jgi:hypothetical protein
MPPSLSKEASVKRYEVDTFSDGTFMGLHEVGELVWHKGDEHLVLASDYDALKAENLELRAEVILLDRVLADARMVLLSSLSNEGEPSQSSLAALNESCRAHFEWRATRISEVSTNENGPGVVSEAV